MFQIQISYVVLVSLSGPLISATSCLIISNLLIGHWFELERNHTHAEFYWGLLNGESDSFNELRAAIAEWLLEALSKVFIEERVDDRIGCVYEEIKVHVSVAWVLCDHHKLLPLESDRYISKYICNRWKHSERVEIMNELQINLIISCFKWMLKT